MKAFAH
jgi:hypothetical protein